MELPLHPPLSSFPIALIVVVTLLETTRAFFPRNSTLHAWLPRAIGLNLLLAGVFLVAAFLTGYTASESANQTFQITDEAIAQHHTFGKFLLFAMVPCLALYFISENALYARRAFRAGYLLMLLLSFALVLYTGYLGGSLVFDHGAGVRATLPKSTP